MGDDCDRIWTLDDLVAEYAVEQQSFLRCFGYIDLSKADVITESDYIGEQAVNKVNCDGSSSDLCDCWPQGCIYDDLLCSIQAYNLCYLGTCYQINFVVPSAATPVNYFLGCNFSNFTDLICQRPICCSEFLAVRNIGFQEPGTFCQEIEGDIYPVYFNFDVQSDTAECPPDCGGTSSDPDICIETNKEQLVARYLQFY